MIAVVDYGMGNTASVAKAVRQLGCDSVLTDDTEILQEASHIILPGVGSFCSAMEEIEKRDLLIPLITLAKSKPFLGICLGMQLLFSEGVEGGHSKGLNLIPGKVARIKTTERLPHIGWNSLHVPSGKPNWGSVEGKYMYFVHSYQAETDKRFIVSYTEYGAEIPAIVRNGSIFGMQFHPEKSGAAGLELLQLFLQEAKK